MQMPKTSTPAAGNPGRRRPSSGDSLLFPTVFLTGASVLILEILGTRLVSPHFGNNVYVWSALISVTLMALAVGYWIGGKVADRRGSPALLDQIITGAAIWTAIVPALVNVLAGALLQADYRTGILVTSLVSFGPALFLLGMITPVAVKLEVADIAHVGRSAGKVYSWSTAGGVSGGLAAGFVLFPLVSVTATCRITALSLLALVMARWLARRYSPAAGFVPPAVVITCGFLFPSALLPSPAWQDGGFAVISNRPSFYGPVRVIEYRHSRLLSIDGMCQNAMDIHTRNSIMPHVAAFELLPYLRPNLKTAVLVGLGGGDMVRLLQRHGVRVKAVEIDPVVVAAAIEHFHLELDRSNIIVSDGRIFLRRSEEKVGFLILDAFTGGTIPAHLLSVEAMREMKQTLRAGGVVALNAVVIPEEELLADLAATLGQEFGWVRLLMLRQPGSEVANAVFFASDTPLRLPAAWDTAPSAGLAALSAELPRMFVEPDLRRGQVITDARNFVEARSVNVDRTLRRGSRALLPASLLQP